MDDRVTAAIVEKAELRATAVEAARKWLILVLIFFITSLCFL